MLLYRKKMHRKTHGYKRMHFDYQSDYDSDESIELARTILDLNSLYLQVKINPISSDSESEVCVKKYDILENASDSDFCKDETEFYRQEYLKALKRNKALSDELKSLKAKRRDRPNSDIAISQFKDLKTSIESLISASEKVDQDMQHLRQEHQLREQLREANNKCELLEGKFEQLCSDLETVLS